MNFNFDLFIDVLWLGTLCGVISTVCLQELKKISSILSNKIASLFVNLLIGYSVSRIFTNLSIKMSICVGVITWIGAETIFEKLKEKNILDEKTDFINDAPQDLEESLEPDHPEEQ